MLRLVTLHLVVTLFRLKNQNIDAAIELALEIMQSTKENSEVESADN